MVRCCKVHQPIKGGCYIQTPIQLVNKQAIVNIKCNCKDECKGDCVKKLLLHFYCYTKINVCRPSSYPESRFLKF